MLNTLQSAVSQSVSPERSDDCSLEIFQRGSFVTSKANANPCITQNLSSGVTSRLTFSLPWHPQAHSSLSPAAMLCGASMLSEERIALCSFRLFRRFSVTRAVRILSTPILFWVCTNAYLRSPPSVWSCFPSAAQVRRRCPLPPLKLQGPGGQEGKTKKKGSSDDVIALVCGEEDEDEEQNSQGD